MSKSINAVTLVGRLGRDPEVKYGKTGTAWVKMSVATEEYNGKGQEPKVVWHTVKAFGKVAELCGECLSKGGLLIVQGKLGYNSYEKDGVKMTYAEVIADHIVFPGRSEKKAAPPKAQDDDGPADPGTGGMDDIPFS